MGQVASLQHPDPGAPTIALFAFETLLLSAVAVRARVVTARYVVVPVRHRT